MEQRLSSSAPTPRRIAVYPGSFDPVHLGHLDIARRAAAMFDRLLVAVFDRPNKRLVFSTEERMELFRRGLAGVANAEVISYNGLTVDLAVQRGAPFIVRGLRTGSDFDYEFQMTGMNRHIRPELEIVFLISAPQHVFLSSTLIKEVAAEGADLRGLVPTFVAEALRARVGASG